MALKSSWRPLTPVLLTVFFLFGTVMTALAGASLLMPGALNWIWLRKPEEHRLLAALGPLVATGFIGLSVLMALTAYGVWRRRRWGWALAAIIFAVNGLSDLARAVTGSLWEGLLGAAIAALILWWLFRPSVRELFS
jgi:hypothetical protein